MAGPRTAIVAHTHPAFTRGGGELAAYRHFRYLHDRGDAAVFAGMTIHPETSRRFFDPGQRVMELGPDDYVIGGTGMDSFEMEHDDPEVEDWLVGFLAGLEADVYHIHHLWNIGAGTIRRLRRLRPEAAVTLTLHDYTAVCANHGQMVRAGSGALCRRSGLIDCAGCFPERPPLDFVVRQARMAGALEMFDLVLSPSRFLRDRFEACGVPAGRITVLENGVPEWPAATGAEDLDALDASSRRFAFFGSATPTKGLDVLARAAEILSAGRGTTEALSIEVHGVSPVDIAAHWPGLPLPPNLLLRGRYEPEEAVPLMRRAGWLVVPSTWWENAPVVIEEARAAGVPVIASDIGGMAEKVADFGLTFRAGDAADLARLIAELAGNTSRLLAHRNRITPPLRIGDYAETLEALVLENSRRGRDQRALGSARAKAAPGQG